MIDKHGAIVPAGHPSRLPAMASKPAAAPNPDVTPFDLTELRNSGLLYIANRALHPFGVAIAANMDEHGRVTELGAIQTRDPLGFVFPEQAENDARRRLFAWLERRLDVGRDRV